MRKVVAIAAAMMVAVTTFSCVGASAENERSGNGFVSRGSAHRAAKEYLRVATERLDETSPTSVLTHLTRAEVDPSYDFDAATIGTDDFAKVFDKIDTHTDTSDFDMIVLSALRYSHGDELTPALRDAIDQRLLSFRYWYTDPAPLDASGQEMIDNKWFWSENHRIIVHGLEYLAGRTLPDSSFAVTGLSGEEHAERGRESIEAWLDEKARWGFSEWHSDVYYNQDVQILTLLAEHAEADIAQRAAAMLDLFLYDLALHQRAGNVGVTHGRSYMKDKSRASDQDVLGTVKLLFDTTDAPYPAGGATAPTLLAGAEHYRLPEVIRRVARSKGTVVDGEHMGAPLDLNQEFSPDPESPVPEAPFDDPDAIPFWWERGALTAWQAVPQTLETIEQYNLWETELFKPYKALGDIGDPAAAQQLAYNLRCMIALGVLSEVDTMTYRTADAMLSSSQDFRPGCFGHQYHAWQATLDEDAVVFTTHPGNEPVENTTGWFDSDLYWSGTGSMPRSGQVGSAAVHMYAPQFESPTGPPLDTFAYLPYTHAYFPTERFDEVRQVGNWTLGRKGDGYVALWSWRPVQWREHDPNVVFTNGLTEPFDLVAEGGADNVWISEVGDAKQWRSFDKFVDAVVGAPVQVTDLGDVGGISQGFEVSYASPAQGALDFSWTGPLMVDGEEAPLHGELRYDNEFGQSEFGDDVVEIDDGRASLEVDLSTGERRARRG